MVKEERLSSFHGSMLVDWVGFLLLVWQRRKSETETLRLGNLQRGLSFFFP